MPPLIRTFDRGDMEFALEQTRREGWDATAELFETCLAHEPDGCFVAELDGRRAGMVTTTRYPRSGWIGNLIVPPECRRQGVGERLMRHALRHLTQHSLKTIRLEADPQGVPLYRRLGFVDEYESLRFRRPAGGRGLRAAATRVTAGDLPAIADLDSACFGDDRRKLLTLLWPQAHAATWQSDEGCARGYILATRSRVGLRIGPWVAEEPAVAESLLRTLLADWPDTTIVLGVPSPNRDAASLLVSHGFVPTPSCLRMVLGERVATGRPERIFAIANGAMG